METVKKEREEMRGCLTLKQVMNETGLSWPTARKLVDEAGAAVKVGRRVLVLSDKFYQHLHSMAEKR